MAVTVKMYECFLQQIGLAKINLDAGDFRVHLLNGSGSVGVNSVVSASTWGSISAQEITHVSAYSDSGSPYGSDGVTVTTNWSSVGTASYQFDISSDITWSANADMSAHAAVLITSASGGVLFPVAHIDFGGSAKAGAGTNFIIQWAASGLFELTAT